MKFKVFLKEERELVVTNEVINNNNLIELIQLAKTADSANDLVLRDKNKTYLPHDPRIIRIKFHNCTFEEIKIESSDDLVAAICEADIRYFYFTGNLSNIAAIKTFYQMAHLITSHLITIDHNELKLENFNERCILNLFTWYGAKWSSYFYPLWQLKLTDVVVSINLRRKIATYQELLRDVSAWRDGFLFNFASQMYPSDFHKALEVSCRQAVKLVKRINDFIGIFKVVQTSDENNILMLTKELLSELKEFIPEAYHKNITGNELYKHFKLLESREIFRGKLSEANSDKHNDVSFKRSTLNIFSNSLNDISLLGAQFLANHSLLFAYAVKLIENDKECEKAMDISRSYSCANEVGSFLLDFNKIDCASLSTSTILSLGLRLLILFHINYKACLTNYSDNLDRDANDLLTGLRRLIEAQPDNAASKWIFSVLEAFLKIEYFASDDNGKKSDFLSALHEKVHSMLSFFKEKSVVQYNSKPAFRNARIDQMHIIQLSFDILRARLELEKCASLLKANTGNPQEKLKGFLELHQRYMQLENEILQEVMDKLENLTVDLSSQVDAFCVLTPLSNVKNNHDFYAATVRKATIAVCATFQDWMSNDELLDQSDKEKNPTLESRIKIYEGYKRVLAVFPDHFADEIEKINHILLRLKRLQKIASMVIPSKKPKLAKSGNTNPPPLPKKKGMKALLPPQSISDKTVDVVAPGLVQPAALSPVIFKQAVVIPSPLDKLFAVLQEKMPSSQPVIFGEFVASALLQVFHPDSMTRAFEEVKLRLFSSDWVKDYFHLVSILPDLIVLDSMSNVYRGTFDGWRVEVSVFHPDFFAGHEFISRRYINLNTLVMLPDGSIGDSLGNISQAMVEKEVRFLPNITQFNHPLMLLDFLYAIINYKFNAFQCDIDFIKRNVNHLLGESNEALYWHFTRTFKQGSAALAFKWWLETGILNVMLPEVAQSCYFCADNIYRYQDFLNTIDSDNGKPILPSALLTELMKMAIVNQCTVSSVKAAVDLVRQMVYFSPSPLLRFLSADKKQKMVQAIIEQLLYTNRWSIVTSVAATLFNGASSLPVTRLDNPSAPSPQF